MGGKRLQLLGVADLSPIFFSETSKAKPEMLPKNRNIAFQGLALIFLGSKSALRVGRLSLSLQMELAVIPPIKGRKSMGNLEL